MEKTRLGTPLADLMSTKTKRHVSRQMRKHPKMIMSKPPMTPSPMEIKERLTAINNRRTPNPLRYRQTSTSYLSIVRKIPTYKKSKRRHRHTVSSVNPRLVSTWTRFSMMTAVRTTQKNNHTTSNPTLILPPNPHKTPPCSPTQTQTLPPKSLESPTPSSPHPTRNPRRKLEVYPKNAARKPGNGATQPRRNPRRKLEFFPTKKAARKPGRGVVQGFGGKRGRGRSV
mmetsp:Transcript_12255/g.19408  ORF Transcript_12255/g.19408 Transcript_12255/m.19408 type:complete len:227 (-) Transcript_12255:34-714(-)